MIRTDQKTHTPQTFAQEAKTAWDDADPLDALKEIECLIGITGKKMTGAKTQPLDDPAISYRLTNLMRASAHLEPMAILEILTALHLLHNERLKACLRKGAGAANQSSATGPARASS